MAAIEILGIEKTYSTGFWRKQLKCALKPLHLEVADGEVFGFLGPNGAGKTTTIKILMGLMYPTAGEARILGMAINHPRVKAQIGFLPEQPYFYDYLTGRELLDYYGRLSGVPVKELPRRIDRTLERVGLEGSGNVQLRKFSKGMLQRVGIAQAILHDPKIVVLDEPMSGLDPIGRREVRDLMAQLKGEGKTVFFSTHILSDAEALCDRVAVLHRGELKGVGSVAELTAKIEGKTELIWQGPLAASLQALGATGQTSGETTRAVIDAARLDAALDALRREHCRLISVNPLRGSLEEYFVQKMAAPTNSDSGKGASA